VTLLLRVTDDNLVTLGDPIERILSITATPQFNAAGMGTVSVPASAAVIDAVLTDRSRLDIIDDGQYFMGGPIEQTAIDVDAAASSGVLTFNFSDDLAPIVDELAYPDTAHDSEHQAASYYAPGAMSGETFMYTIVDDNVGPSALTARKISKLTVGTAVGLGGSVTLSTRFEPMGDLLRRTGIAAGGLGFRTVVDGYNRRFEVYDPTNLTRQIRFTGRLNNLRTAHLEISKPTCNVAIVGGDGTGTSRTIVERTNPASIARWGRIVKFVNAAQTAVLAEMQAAGDQALADGAERGQVTFVATDNADTRYGRDYVLGNIVTCEPFPGLELAEIVRAVTLTYTPKTGKVIQPLLGSDSAITDSKQLAVLRAVERRVGYPERS
jgi:hypothetical protein